MIATKKMEVRCCCQPQKLLGWLPARDGVVATFHATDGACVSLPIATMAVFNLLDPHSDRKQAERVLNELSGPADAETLVIDSMASKRWRCYKAEGMTVDQLRRIAEFEPAP